MYPGSNAGSDVVSGLTLFTASRACSKGFGFSCFPPSTKTDISKFQFNVETVDVRASLWDVPLQIHIYLYYLRYFPLDTA